MMSPLERLVPTMARFNFVYILSIVLSLFISTGCVMAATSSVVKAGYYPSWALDNFPPSAINTSFFTHIIYAFLVPNNVTFKFHISTSTAKILSNFTTTLHQKKPPVKALYSLGGGGISPDPFGRMASTASTRQIFINATIDVARKYGFDGFDLDWEFPESPKEMNDLAQLLKEWRYAIQKEAKITHRPPLLLTAAVYYSADFLAYGARRSYPAASIKNNLDWINVMCYEYHGSWDTSATGAHAALFDPKTNLSSIYGLKSWIKAGVPRNKIAMGLPLYGKTWKLKDPNLHGVGAPAVDVGPGRPGDVGVLLYSEVEEFNKKNNATIAYDVDTASTYSYVGSVWVGYDDALSTTMKVGFAQALGLRGYFFWAISYDSEWKVTSQGNLILN
uniref:GH18 domain-containing protein n=1 Tax=Fagus sylvatica TaxID=28930 RepID=A0A2N9FWC3_FAGSY